MNLRWAAVPNADGYEIERRFDQEANFSPLASVSALIYRDTTIMLYQDAEYRVCATNASGRSAWVNATGLARNGVRGTVLGNGNAAGNASVFDGDVGTVQSGDTGISDIRWSGLDFGEAKEISALRFVPNPTASTANRMRGGYFELADDPDFTIGVTVVHTISTTVTPPFAVTEIAINPPVTARYARYCSLPATYNGSGVTEVEFIESTPRPPLVSTRMETSEDQGVTTTNAVVFWTLWGPVPSVSSSLVYRAEHYHDGTYTLMTPQGLPLSQAEWTDETVVPGTHYFYKVSTVQDASPVPLEGPRSACAIYPCKHIERDPANLTTLRPGVTLHPLPPLHGSLPYAFDGNLATSPDGTGTLRVGLNLGKPYCIQYMRHAARYLSGGQGPDRLNGALLSGSNDDTAAYPTSYQRLATFAGAKTNEYTTQVIENREPFQYISANPQFGNIAELELYGFAPDEFTSPPPPRGTVIIVR